MTFKFLCTKCYSCHVFESVPSRARFSAPCQKRQKQTPVLLNSWLKLEVSGLSYLSYTVVDSKKLCKWRRTSFVVSKVVLAEEYLTTDVHARGRWKRFRDLCVIVWPEAERVASGNKTQAVPRFHFLLVVLKNTCKPRWLFFILVESTKTPAK